MADPIRTRERSELGERPGTTERRYSILDGELWKGTEAGEEGEDNLDPHPGAGLVTEPERKADPRRMGRNEGLGGGVKDVGTKVESTRDRSPKRRKGSEETEATRRGGPVKEPEKMVVYLTMCVRVCGGHVLGAATEDRRRGEGRGSPPRKEARSGSMAEEHDPHGADSWMDDDRSGSERPEDDAAEEA